MLKPSRRNEARPLTDKVFDRLFTKLSPRIPPLGEQLSHPLQLSPSRSQIEEVSPSRVTDLLRSLRSRFEANSTRHEFEKLVEARGPFRGIESPARRNRVLRFSWGGSGGLASILVWSRAKEISSTRSAITEQVVGQFRTGGLLFAVYCNFRLASYKPEVRRYLPTADW